MSLGILSFQILLTNYLVKHENNIKHEHATCNPFTESAKRATALCPLKRKDTTKPDIFLRTYFDDSTTKAIGPLNFNNNKSAKTQIATTIDAMLTTSRSLRRITTKTNTQLTTPSTNDSDRAVHISTEDIWKEKQKENLLAERKMSQKRSQSQVSTGCESRRENIL